MGAAASSSSSSSSAYFPRKYDVFLSFRGEDTRKTFTSHLHTALCMSGIRTYIDYELPKGDDISQSLIQAIEDSSISAVIFSETYASSKWCLNELLKILECKEVQGQLVIPIFYQVDPSHVRNQKGTYQEAFEKHYTQNPEKVKQWKRALFETANLAGWDSRIYRDESQLIHNIVNDILKRLEHMYPSTLQGLVGIEENADCIESLLGNASIIGIWGMGGIGKTTMAKAVFNKLSFQFESCCFFENLREESEKYGLKHIRDKLLRELLMEEESMVRSTSFAMRRLSCKKVFIVLDDVNKINQLEYLAKECHALGPGSKVIITTRDKHLLLGRVNEIYEAKPLSDYKSVSLFNLKAFHKDDYESGYEELSERVVAYAKGNPLALITLGSFLYSKTIDEWESALTKLEKTSHEDIHAVLKLSYDGLNYEEREMFLEIACFLKGESIAKVVALLDSYGYHATIGLRTLVDKALIRISSYYVEMHDLIQQMGREIVRQECVKNPGRRSRLWNPDEIYDALKNNRVTDAVEGISLDLSQIGDICLTSNTLKKMTNLRFLKFYSSNSDRRSCVNIPSSQGSFSNHLSYLQWDNFPFEALPSSFCAEKLVELSMNGSKLKKLWDGTQDLVNLRGLDLGGSKQLAELPDFSKARKLEWVNLFSCESLSHLHPSILSLHRLKSLGLTNCIKLKHLQSESPLKSLESLSVDNCYGLKEFSLSSESMTVLQLNRTGIESLGSSIGYLQKLTSLSLNCSRLKNIPVNEFYGLRSLKDLTFSDCGEIIDESKLYILFDALQCLISIHLDGSCILTELPDNIKHLSRLEFLSLINCKSLQSLPELPPSIKDLDATNCTSLETLILTSHTEFPLLPQQIMQNLTPYSSIRYLRNLRRLILSCCNIGNRSLSHIMAFAYFCLKRGVHTNQMVDVCYPGREVPDCFKHNQTTKAPNFITIELSSTMNNLQGFIFYAVLPQFTPKESCSYRVKCQIYDEDGECGTSLSFVITNVNSHHVFLWTTHKNIFTKYPDANYKPKLSFEFYVVTYDSDDFIGFGFMKETKHDGLIEACGVCPIYAPDYHNFLQQEELELGTREQRTFEDIEEHSFRGILEYASLSLKQAKCGGFETSTIPEWFAYKSLTTGSSVSVQLNPSFDGLLGFVFCFVIPQFSLKERDLRHSSCGYYDENNIYQEGPRGWHYSMIGLNSNNVFLWYDPLYCELILEDIQSRIGPSKSGKYESKVTFEFKFGDCLIKEGGVRPIYASEYREFLQQKELELKLITGKKRCRSIDDEPQQPTATKKWKMSSILQPVPLSSESKTSHDVDELIFSLSQLNLESTKDRIRHI